MLAQVGLRLDPAGLSEFCNSLIFLILRIKCFLLPAVLILCSQWEFHENGIHHLKWWGPFYLFRILPFHSPIYQKHFNTNSSRQMQTAWPTGQSSTCNMAVLWCLTGAGKLSLFTPAEHLSQGLFGGVSLMIFFFKIGHPVGTGNHLILLQCRLRCQLLLWLLRLLVVVVAQ